MDSQSATQNKSILDENDEACLHALQYANSCMTTMVLNTAIELDVFGTIAAAGPGAQLSVSEIAAQLPTKNQDVLSRLDRMLRLLVAHSFLRCSLQTLEDGSVERRYGLAPPSKFLLGTADEGSLASAVTLGTHRDIVQIWFHSKDTIMEGGDPFKRIHGIPSYQYIGMNSSLNNIFNQAMVGISTITLKKIIEIYKGFEGLTSLVDVGGGTGNTLNMIISKYPSIKGINFDLPHVTECAPSYPGIEHVGGDMFSSIPKADAIMLKEVLHNWSDEHCLKILKNCCEVLPKNGKVIIVTMINPEVPDSSMPSKYIAALDNVMLMSVSGKERTKKEFEELCKKSGFSRLEVACSAFDVWNVIEFYK